MFHFVSRILCAGLVLLPALAAAEPINLKLSFFTSDRSQIYQSSVKAFVDAVNAEGAGVVHIEVYFSGAIARCRASRRNWSPTVLQIWP